MKSALISGTWTQFIESSIISGHFAITSGENRLSSAITEIVGQNG